LLPAARRFLALALVCAALAPAAAGAGGETVRLIPDDRAGFRGRNLFAWLRPGYSYGDRYIDVTTTPPGATLDLFYVRSNFQKRYEQTGAPVRVILPRRVEAGPRDAVNIRAFLDGYRQKEVSIRVSSSQKSVHIDLEPLPNRLEAVSHTYFAGRSSLAFLTRESLTVQVQEVEGGFRVVLSETAKGAEVGDFAGLRSPLVESLDALQLGEDLLVRAKLAPGVSVAKGGSYALRTRQSRDELRDLWVYHVDLVPADGGVLAVEKARAALGAIGAGDVGGCAARFDEALHGSLDAAALARALAPRGAFTDPYLRAAMKRLGEVSPGGRIAMRDGSALNPASAIELTAAMSQPADAIGFLALLRSFVDRLEPAGGRHETLRGLVAPEVEPARFDAMLDGAEQAERGCLASR
jgi:hypothetical protein